MQLLSRSKKTPCSAVHSHVWRLECKELPAILLYHPHILNYRWPSVRRRRSTSLEQSTACSSFALYIAQFFQKTSEIISVWTVLLPLTTCILTALYKLSYLHYITGATSMHSAFTLCIGHQEGSPYLTLPYPHSTQFLDRPVPRPCFVRKGIWPEKTCFSHH